MRTQKRTFLGIDITPRKSLYAEIDALTEENREQAAKIDRLEASSTKVGITVQRLNAKAAEFEEKYNAAVKYQQNTQAAYDMLKTDYDRFLARTRWGGTEVESKGKIAKADAVPTGCETAKEIKTQERSKNGRFAKKHKRDDDPRK